MTGASADLRAGGYGVSWLCGGIVSGGLLIWLVTLVGWDLRADRAEQQLTALANISYGLIGLMALVTLGLTMRNAIRNFKGSVGAASLEANGAEHDA